MRPKRSCLASMIHPILQSDAEPDKPEPFLLNKWQTKPVRYAAALTVGKRRPRLNWRFVSTKESFSRADSESMSHAAAMLGGCQRRDACLLSKAPKLRRHLGESSERQHCGNWETDGFQGVHHSACHAISRGALRRGSFPGPRRLADRQRDAWSRAGWNNGGKSHAVARGAPQGYRRL